MRISPRTKISLIIILLVIFFIILNLFGFSQNIKNFFYFVSAPIQKTFWGAGDKVSDFFEVEERNEVLELKIQELSAEIARLKNLEKENRVLREALDIGLPKEFEIVFAEITSKTFTQDSILINIGSDDGILKNMPVISPQKILVGKISQVYDNFSRVMLVSNKESAFPINIQKNLNNIIKENNETIEKYKEYNSSLLFKKEDVEAIIHGKGNFQVKINRIPLGVEIKENDRVVTSALGSLFPSGILIGYVKNIERLGVELFQRAEIRSAIDIIELRNVFVITDF